MCQGREGICFLYVMGICMKSCDYLLLIHPPDSASSEHAWCSDPCNPLLLLLLLLVCDACCNLKPLLTVCQHVEVTNHASTHGS